VGLRVSRDHRYRQYLMLCTRLAPRVYPTSSVVQRVPTRIAKLHGIRLMKEILYVCSPMMCFLLSWLADYLACQYREKNVNQRLEPTVVAAETELFKSTRKGE
jgi:hypothetical protein